ncbi:egg cell-secreted protein 1.3-like [Argentina anserina]|uniref:egg cell-secreted protein 1.3-like n=1 Tax=Argentina anserina TaxID=57926 RepID=UPI0021763992|nr:egg cell-secreted protein 1.3-like [Potentilla anserina]
MASNTSNLFLTLTALIALTIPFMAIAYRPLVTNKPTGSNPSLAARLNLDGESSSNCWDSFLQLQSCSGEAILFFLNGETTLGDRCCEAIRVIEHQCWPALLGSLGFTIQETDILRGYCDEAEQTHHSPPSIPAPPSVFHPNRALRVPYQDEMAP